MEDERGAAEEKSGSSTVKVQNHQLLQMKLRKTWHSEDFLYVSKMVAASERVLGHYLS